MTDKEKLDAIRAEVQNYIYAAHKAHTNITEGNFAHLLSFIDSLQEEPTEVKHKKCMYALNDFNDEDRKILCDGCEEDCEYNKKGTVNDKLGGINNALVQDRLITSKPIGVPADTIELVSIPDKKEPVSDDTMTIRKEWFEQCKKSWYNEGYLDGKYNRDSQFGEPVSDNLEKIVEEIAEPTILNAYGTKELARRLRNTILCGTSVSEDLGEYINELSKQFPEVSFAKLSRIAVRVAKWQKQQDQETIELAEDHAMLAGMEKMKEQLMASGTDVTVHMEAGNYPYIPQIELYDYDKDIPLAKEGDKYKVILIKES